jgi:DNA-binding NtrC family response regulator
LSGTLADVAKRVVSAAERRKIDQTLKEAGGNKNRAAELLQVSFKTLLTKLKDYGLE